MKKTGEITAKAKTVSVIEVTIEDRGEYLYACSNDIPGLHLADTELKTLLTRIEPAIKALYKLNKGIDVEVVAATDPAFPVKRPGWETIDRTRKFVLSTDFRENRVACA